MIKNNEEFSLETPSNHYACRFFRHSYSITRKTLPTTLVTLLERIPDISWGILGDKFPAFTTFITVALILPSVIMGFAVATIITLCMLAFLFPLNYIVSVGVMSPIILLMLSVQYKAFRRDWETLLHPMKYNPNAVEEYKQLLNS